MTTHRPKTPPLERATNLVRNEATATAWTDLVLAWYAEKPPGWTSPLRRIVEECGREPTPKALRDAGAALRDLGWKAERWGVGRDREYRWIPPRTPRRPVDASSPAAVQVGRQDTARQIIDKLCAEKLFPQQLAYVLDDSPFQGAFAPRRAGKSIGDAYKLARGALLYPGRESLFAGLTGGHAEMIMKSSLEKAVAELGGGVAHYNQQTNIMSLENGSKIRIVGLSASPMEQEKQLGGAFHGAIIDEAQAQTQNLGRIAVEKIAPASADYLLKGGGWVALSGTPGEFLGQHFWWLVTKQTADGAPAPDRVPGWAVHEWKTTDNPWMRAEYDAVVERLRELWKSDDFMREPGFMRQWLGRWVLDLEAKVYRFTRTKNTQVANDVARDLALGAASRRSPWIYLMGVDLGWEDATAVVVVAYRPKDRRLYVVRSEKKSHATYEQVGAWLVEWARVYLPTRIVVDSAGIGKQLAQSLAARYSLGIVPAGKTDKADHVARMNADFSTELIQVVPGDNGDLIREWDEHVLDPKKREAGEWAEYERTDNHLCDAALYAWRDAQHFLQKEAADEERTSDTVAQKLEQVAKRNRRAHQEARRKGMGRAA